MKRFDRPAALAFAVLLSAVAAAAAADAWVQAPEGSEGWYGRSRGGRTCVADREGARETCWEEPWYLTDLHEVAGGWIAAGHGRAESGRELVLREWRDGELLEVPAPPGAEAPRGQPRLVTDGARLLGLVWLEGGRQEELAVLFAEWLGDDWGPIGTVSPPGIGSQVAPTVTVLADGRWLVLWTAFDGSDDETLWSVLDGARVSAPARVHEDNGTPDILPAVLATRRGAVAGWTWLDGRDYRLRIASFDGRSWRLEPPRPGRGADGPRLLAAGGTTVLLTSTVVPEEWVVLDVDPRGRVVRRASAPADRPDPPIVEPTGGGVSLRWPEDEPLTEIFVPWEDER